jgi:large subunit ribosomal protein L4
VATLKKYNLAGQETGTVSVDDIFANTETHSQSVKDYIVALRANARQWSANTLTRAEVKHTTKKPHKQKGTGRARQGSLVTPQFRGGGIVFGPKPKFDQHVRINKKERRAAIKALIAEKIRAERIHLVEDIAMDAPKTKTLVTFMQGVGIVKRALFLTEAETLDVEGQNVNITTMKHDCFSKSMRNIPKTHFSIATNVNGYDLARAHDIVISETAFTQLLNWLQ